MSSEENPFVLETIHSSLSKHNEYTKTDEILRNLTILSGHFNYSKRESPQLYTAYARLLENLSKLPVDCLKLEQWEGLIESLGEDKRIDKSVYELSDEEKSKLKRIEEKEEKALMKRIKGETPTIEEKEQKDLIKKRKNDLTRRNRILLMNTGIISKIFTACWNSELIQSSKKYIQGEESLPEADEDFKKRSKVILTILNQEWKDIPFKEDDIKSLLTVSLAYTKRYINENIQETLTVYDYVVGIHGQAIKNYFAIRELRSGDDNFTETLVKGYMETLKNGATKESDRYLHLVNFYLDCLPWLDQQISTLEYEIQIWSSIETIISMVEEEFNGQAESETDADASSEDMDKNWLENICWKVPADLDRKHQWEMMKCTRIKKLRVHICSLLNNLTEKSIKVDSAMVKRILHKLCDLTTTDFGSHKDIHEAFERIIKIGAISDSVQKEIIDDCLNQGIPQSELAVTKIVMVAQEDLRNELAEKVFRFFVERLKTKHSDGEKHSFSLNDLLLCRNARLAMIPGKSTLFQELLKYFNSLCLQKRIAVDPLIDEIMSLMHILFAGGNFLEYFKQCMSHSAVEIITEQPEAEKLTPIGEMDCAEKDLSLGFRHFALWSLTQPGDLCPPYVYPIFTDKELEERDDFVVLSHMFRLLPYYKSTAGGELFRKLYTDPVFSEKIEKYYASSNIETLFSRILTLFTEDIQKRTGKTSSMGCHYILSFYDSLLVAISSDMTLSPETIELLRNTLKHLDLYELSLACARWNYRTGLDRLSALFKIYRNYMLTECMSFQRMVDDCVLPEILNMMHNDKKKTISPAYPPNSFKLSYEKLDCVLSSDEPTVIEGIIECIRSELCTYLFDQFNQLSNPKSSTSMMDEMVKFCIEVASSAQYSIDDAHTANNFLNLMVQENYALHHVFIMDTILAVATSTDPMEQFEKYPLNKLFGDVVGELFCSDIYSKKWMKNPSMYPIEKYLDLCASDEPCALNPNFVASLSNILTSNVTHPTIKESLGATVSARLNLLPQWINNSLYPAITLSEFSGILSYLKEQIAGKMGQIMTDCVDKVIRESVTTELAEFIPIEVQSTDRFAQSWLCSRRKKEPPVLAHMKLHQDRRDIRKYFQEAMIILCQYGDVQTYVKLAQTTADVLGNWCGLTGTEEKVVRGEIVLKDYFHHLFRLSVANTLLQYTSELFTTIGEEKNDGYFSDNEAVKEIATRKGIQCLPSQRLENKTKSPSSLCTYIATEAKYLQQHWYNCYTCNFTGQTGCCSVCAVNCHRGHEVVYSKYGSFFCDCGAKKCASMKSTSHIPNANNAARGRKITMTNTTKCEEIQESMVFAFTGDILSVKEELLPCLIELKDKLTENAVGIENAVRASVDAHINTYNIESKRNHVLKSLKHVEQIKLVTNQPIMDILDKETRQLTNISTPKRPPEPAHLDNKARDLCGRIVLGNGRQLWLMVDGSTFTIHHISQGDNIVDELNTARQETEQLAFSAKRMSCCEDKAVIIGRSEVLLLRFGNDGEITDRTPINLAEITTQTNPFTKAVWAPKRTGILALATVQYVRIYDVFIDTYNHLEELVLPVGNIQDISLVEEQGQLILLVFSNAGHLYRHIVTAQLPQNNSIFLTNTINVPNPPTGLPVSFHYTPASKILFISYENSSWFGVVTPETFQLEGTTIEWRKIPSEHAFSCWQEASGIVAAMNHQGGSCVTYFYPTTEQLIMQKVENFKRTPYAHLLYTSPSNTTVNALLFFYDSPHIIPLTSHWASLPDLWIDGLPLEFSTTMEIVKEDPAEDLPIEDLIPMMECCEPLERVEITSTDLLRYYDPQDMSTRLGTVGNCPITIIQTNNFSVSLRCPDQNYIARAVRIEVPENKGPQKVTIGSRTISLQTTMSRFFDIPLTRAESLDMETVPLFLDFQGRDNYMVLTSVKLYGIRKRDFGFPSPQLSSRAPLSLPEEHLKHMLKLLHVLAENDQIVGNRDWLIKITEQLVSIRSTNREVCTAANTLLRVLFNRKSRLEYYELKDTVLYDDLIHLTESPHPLPSIIVDRLCQAMKMVLLTRSWRFLEKLKTISQGEITLLSHIRSQLSQQKIDENLNLVEMFCLLSFTFMSTMEGPEAEKIYDIFLGIFLDEKAAQHASGMRLIALNLISTFALTSHTDRQKIYGSKGPLRVLKHAGILPFYQRSRIISKLDDIPKEEDYMGPAENGDAVKKTNMYDEEAKFLVNLVRRVMQKIRNEGIVMSTGNIPSEPAPTFQLVMFAYNMLHNLAPDRILPIILELIEMVDWKSPVVERTDSVCRQLLLFRLVVLFLTKCTEYTEKGKKSREKKEENASRENSVEAPEDKTAALPPKEDLGKRESYEKLLHGIADKLLEVDCLSYCLKMLQKSIGEWKGPNPDASKNSTATKAWGPFSGEHPTENFKTDEDQKDHFYGTVMQLGTRLPLQMKKINPKLVFGSEWTDVLCEIHVQPYPTTIRHYARKLLILLANNDKQQYKSLRDLYLMRTHMKNLKEKFKDTMNHKELTEIVDIIASLSVTATERPLMWRTICEEHLTWMLDMVTRVADAVTTNVLELLVAAIRVETNAEETQLIANRLISLDENREALKKLLLRFLVGRDEARRWLAHGLVRSTIQLASRNNQMILVRIMWYELWPAARENGSNGAQLADLLANYLPRVFNTTELLTVCDIELAAIHEIAKRIQSEGHDRTYEMMMGLGLGWNFMLMVSNPCLNCFSKKRTSETMKLSNIKQDIRFSSNAQMVKLIGFYEVNRVIIKMSDVKRAKTVKKISIYYCPKVVDSPVELKTRPELWQLAGSTSAASAENEMIVSLSVPVVTSSLIIQFTELSEARHNNELQCPRCSSVVQPNPGVCENCGENAYQCFKCRSINYDDKDPFLCQHCGFCKYARIDISVVCRPLPRVQPILTDSDRTAAIDHMSHLLVDVEQSRSQMLIGRAMCESLWLRSRPLPVHTVRAEGTHIAEMAVAGMPIIPINEHAVYCIKEIINYCSLAHDELCSQTQQLLAYRDELLQYDGAAKEIATLGNGFYNTSSSCFGCLCTGIRHSIAILQGASDDPYCAQKILNSPENYQEIVRLGRAYIPLIPDMESFMCRLAFENESGSRLLCQMVEEGLLPGSILCKSLSLYPDSFWEMKLRQLLTSAVEKNDEDTVINTLQVIEGILNDSGHVRKRAYRKLQYGENSQPEDGLHRTIKIKNRPVDNRENMARWMNRKGTWDECENDQQKAEIDGEKIIEQVDQWLWQCLFSQWTMVRSMAAKVLHSMSKHPGYLGSAIRIIIRGISLAHEKSPQTTEQFFNAIHSILNRRKHLKMRLYLHGLHVHLLHHIHDECRQLYLAEYRGTSIDHGNGILLRDYIEVLVTLFCGDSSEGFLLKAAVPHIMKPLLQSTIYLKRLLLHRTRSIDICRHALELLLRKVSAKEPLMLMHTAVKSLEDDVDQFTQAQIFSVIMEVLAPERHKDDGFLIQIEKDPAQEDFLQGRMTGNPYRSNDIGMGPLMRDIKNKICRDTEMITLLEDDNGMELLVNNQIISLSLPVSRVYEKLWHRDHPGQPLTIVYRMRGLMGDAVEQFIETLGTAEENSAEDTALSSLVEQFTNCGGITKTLGIIEHCDITTGGRILLGSVLNLLERVSKSEKGRISLVKAGAVRVFTKTFRKCVESGDDSMLAIGKDFLKLLETLVNDINTHDHLHDLTADDAQWLINLALKKGENDVSEDIAKILGNLTLGNEESEDVLVSCCKQGLQWCVIDTTTDVFKRAKIVIDADIFCEIVAGILPSTSGHNLKNKIVESGVLAEACAYLLNSHPPLYSATESQEWKAFLMRPSLRLMLTFMNSMAKGHLGSQNALSESSLPLLHRLEQVASDNSIGTLAENVMESLKENKQVADKIEAVRLETKQKKRQMAMAMRNKQLSKMGMQIGKQGEVKIAARKIANEPHLEEVVDPLTACCICREPLLNGEKAAAVYAFANVTSISEHASCINTVSQMVLVHIDCHMAAVRRSGGGRTADEWSKAMLHNAGARCNVLTPLALHEGPFQQALARFQTDLDVITSTPAVTRGLVFMDMCLLIDRFVNFTSFSDKSQGGGRESNAQYLGVLHLLACSLPASDELRTLLPPWCVYSFLLTEETLEQWTAQRTEVLTVALNNRPGDRKDWPNIRGTCLSWGFVDLYFKDVIPIVGERLPWLREHFLEIMKKSTAFIQKFDGTLATATDFRNFASIMDLNVDDFTESVELPPQKKKFESIDLGTYHACVELSKTRAYYLAPVGELIPMVLVIKRLPIERPPLGARKRPLEEINGIADGLSF